MATVRLTDATLSIGDVNLANYVTGVELPIETEPEPDGWATDRLAALKDGTLSVDFSGHWDGPPLFTNPVDRSITVTIRPRDLKAWRAYYRRHLRPQIGRMRAAYRRKKRGRW